MNTRGRLARRLLGTMLRSAEAARAYTLTTLAAVFSTFAIERVAGEVTTVTIIIGLCLIGAAILFARRKELSALRFAPTSLLAFVVWAACTGLWSLDRPSTVTGWMTLAGFGFLALIVAHIRDTLQTVRALGDVLRWLLSISLIVEILSGVLLDIPFQFLGVAGDIAHGGPIQGLFGTRNLLGFVTVIALITFVVEWRTQSVRRGIAMFSVVLAGLLAVLSASPTVLVLAVAVLVATLALTIVRHTEPSRRVVMQWSLGGLVVAGLAIAYAFRHRIIAWLDAGSDFSTRADLWNEILEWVRFRPVQGWGWYGAWDPVGYPFNIINFRLSDHHASALNAYFDVLLQAGWAGLLLFAVVCAVALVRSWLVASTRRSVVYAWTPLMLVALMVDSMFESFTLGGLGWVMLVLCAVRAGQSRSWRETIDAAAGGESQDPLGRAG